MQQEMPVIVFIIIAVVTPVVALAAWLALRRTQAQSGEPTPPPVPKKTRRNLGILALAGPVNLLVWFLFNGWLDRTGSRSVVGYVLAALVFVIAGYATGFFSRLRQGRRSGHE